MWRGLFLVLLSIAACYCSLEDRFTECGGFYWRLYRRCCTSDELPNGCECFDISNSTGYINTGYFTPYCPDRLGVDFLLFDQEHQVNGTEIRAGEENIQSTSFSGSRRTVFVTHGFYASGRSQVMNDIKNELLIQEDLNVILVDWRRGARGPNYYRAAANTRTVGAMIARLIQDLNLYTDASFESFHLVGHSLGAHTMGYAGTEIRRLTGQKVGRITGLDPAGPRFEGFSEYIRLDPNDAIFVDAIHTDGEELLSAGFGTDERLGHADFFPNGGVHQPGCPEERHGILSLLEVRDDVVTGSCSHSRALRLFKNSINNCMFYLPGGNCPMGYHAREDCTGEFYPNTTDTKPYC